MRDDDLDTRTFECAGESWVVARVVPMWAGSHVLGARLPELPIPGLRFTSASGAERFLKMGLTELPHRADFESIAEGTLCSLLQQAKPS